MDLHDLDAQIQAAIRRIDLAALPMDILPAALTPAKLARLIDHTLLKPETGEEQIRQLCAEALHYQFASVCVNPLWIPLCAELLAGSPVKAVLRRRLSLGRRAARGDGLRGARGGGIGRTGVRHGHPGRPGARRQLPPRGEHHRRRGRRRPRARSPPQGHPRDRPAVRRAEDRRLCRSARWRAPTS